MEIINKYNQNLQRINLAAKKASHSLSIEEIKQRLKENIGNNPLLLWEKDQARCEISLTDPEKIRVKPMQYSP